MMDHTKSEVLTQKEFMRMAREVLVSEASRTNRERKGLETELEKLEMHHLPLLELKQQIEKHADSHAQRKVFSFFAIIMGQFMLSQYGTYVVFSWDIMEPITCAMTLGDAIIAYFFWIWTKTSYTMGNFRTKFFEKKKLKLSKKMGYDETVFGRNEKAMKIVKNRLNELK